MRIYLDIETIPSQHPEARERARASVKPPGNLKKPESIAAWWESEGEQAIEDAYRKQALDATEGEIVSLAYAIDRHPPAVRVRPHGQSEADYLREVLDTLRMAHDAHQGQHQDPRYPDPAYIIGHNVEFDLGFIRRRAWVHGLFPPSFLPSHFARSGRDYGDTMTMWAGYGGRISLDRLCTTLGIPSPKQGMDGADVFALWQAQAYDVIAQYNLADVNATRAAWLRMNYEDAA